VDERERLLAEGPRVAPEPEAAPEADTGMETDTGMNTDLDTATSRSRSRSRSPRNAAANPAKRPFSRRSVGRLIPVTVFGLTLLAQVGRQGAYVAAAVGAIVVATVAVALVRRATR
jgi:hypothetical protein